MSGEDTNVFMSPIPGNQTETVVFQGKFSQINFADVALGWSRAYSDDEGDNIPGPVACTDSAVYVSSWGYYNGGSIGNQIYLGSPTSAPGTTPTYTPEASTDQQTITAIAVSPYIRVLVATGDDSGEGGGVYSYTGGTWTYSAGLFLGNLDEDSSGNTYLGNPYLTSIH
jgi:hypothetical protein